MWQLRMPVHSYDVDWLYRMIKKYLCTWLGVFEQFPHNWWFEDGHHRIHSECGPCYTEHGLWEHSLACQQMSGEWWGTLWTLLVTFCIVIIRCTQNFDHPIYRSVEKTRSVSLHMSWSSVLNMNGIWGSWKICNFLLLYSSLFVWNMSTDVVTIWSVIT